jgi:hypothetical protein
VAECSDRLTGGVVVRWDLSDWPDHGRCVDFDLARVQTFVCADLDVRWLWQPELDGIEMTATTS